MPVESGSKRKIDKKLKLVLRATKNANERKKSPGISDVGKSGKGQGVERRKLKSRSNGKEFDNGGDDDEESVRGNFESGSKRKRIYAKQNENEELNATTKAKNKASSKKQQSKMKANSNNEPSRSIWVSKSREAASSKLPSHELKEMVENESVVKSKRRIKGKEADYNGAEKKGKSKPSPSKLSYKTTQKVAKKAAKGKKTQGDDESNNMEEQPKKKKRIIRLDPYDISNKRLDDGLSAMEPSKDKKKESEKDVEMSKNAQFRAIKPSTSILSYVEDNLLGRRRMIELKRAGYNTELSAPLDNIPFSTSTERERIEENIFRNKLEFFAAAKISSSFPPPELPEIAFAGRSNVGKSSLLNALTRQWGVARTSDKPGFTQSINFFKLGTKLCLVDLPGYGFAYAKEEVKDAWEELVKEYASTRVGLKRVCLLIDTKWGMKPRDHELIDLMERSRTTYQIVLTKTDVVFPIDVARRAMQIEESLKANKSIVQPIVMVSSKTGAGIRSLRTVLSKIARFAKA